MNLPNYRDGSLVNLMSSILGGFGASSSYRPLRQFSPREVKDVKNVVLLVIDGLGHDYLMRQDGVLREHVRGKITSVFPTTTAACVSTFFTGVAPQQHAMTGWFMHMKEVGGVVVPLRFAFRAGRLPLEWGVGPKELFSHRSIFRRLGTRSYVVHGKNIAHSPYNSAFTDGARKVGYTTLRGMFRQLRRVVARPGRKFVYSYWAEFDALSHHHGKEHKKVAAHFREINRQITDFLRRIEGTNTLLIVTADHGQVTTPPSQVVMLADHPRLAEMLALPLCGDSRAAYCYVRPSKIREFEAYVKKNFGGCCEMYRSDELVRKGLFGLFAPNKKLLERVGDYVLMMKNNYIIKDFIMGEEKKINVGNHGGLSEEELFVPLVVVRK